jgi:hypothetical protein
MRTWENHSSGETDYVRGAKKRLVRSGEKKTDAYKVYQSHARPGDLKHAARDLDTSLRSLLSILYFRCESLDNARMSFQRRNSKRDRDVRSCTSWRHCNACNAGEGSHLSQYCTLAREFTESLSASPSLTSRPPPPSHSFCFFIVDGD